MAYDDNHLGGVNTKRTQLKIKKKNDWHGLIDEYEMNERN